MAILFLSRSQNGWVVRRVDNDATMASIQPAGFPWTAHAADVLRTVLRENPGCMVAIHGADESAVA